jgi:hypothetical protein
MKERQSEPLEANEEEPEPVEPVETQQTHDRSREPLDLREAVGTQRIHVSSWEELDLRDAVEDRRDRAGPEHIDLATLSAVSRSVREAQVGLSKPSISEADIQTARAALREVSSFIWDRMWQPLETVAREAEQAGLARLLASPVGGDVQRAVRTGQVAQVVAALSEAAARELWQAGLADQLASSEEVEPLLRERITRLLDEATSDQPDSRVQQAVQAYSPTAIIATVRVEVDRFVDEAQQLASQPPPPATDQKSRAAWIARASEILSKAGDLFKEVAVAAVFAVPAVQLAAQRVVHATTELADRALNQIGPALPSLLVITAMAALGISLAKDTLWSLTPKARPGEERPRKRPHE